MWNPVYQIDIDKIEKIQNKFTRFLNFSSFRTLEITNDDKLPFEKHIRNIASSISQKTCLIRKCYKTHGNNDAVLKSF